MSLQQLLDDAADQALGGRRVTVLDVRRLRADRRRRSVRRGLVVAAACLALAIPLALLVAGGWSPVRRAEPAGREGGFVVPTRIADLSGARPLVDSSGAVTAERLSMAFLGTLRGQLTPVALDAATGRAVLLPELGTDVPGLDAAAVADVSQAAVPVLVALSPDGRTVVVSYQNPWDAWDLALDLAADKATLVHQKAPARDNGAELLTVAALDGGRYALPFDDLAGVRVGQVGGPERAIALPGLDAGAGLVVEGGADGRVLVTGERSGRPWTWQVDAAGRVTDGAARWVPTSGWAAARPDDAGRLVALDGRSLVAYDLRTGAASTVGPVRVAGQSAGDLRVVSAVGGRVVLTDDGRQRTARFVSGAEPHHLLAVRGTGDLQTLTTFALPRSESGPATSSLAVASSVLATAHAVAVDPGSGAPSGWWWLLLLAPALLAAGAPVAALDTLGRHRAAVAARRPTGSALTFRMRGHRIAGGLVSEQTTRRRRQVVAVKGKLILGAGVAIGYVLGSRSGRQSYERLKARSKDVWSNPTVQQQVSRAEEAVKAQAPVVAEQVAHAAKQVAEKATHRGDDRELENAGSGI